MSFCRKNYKFEKNFNVIVQCVSPKPQFDVNITNYITLVNFSINLESLTAQLLQIVVKNERFDLEAGFNESTKEAYESIANLKGI